MIWLVKCTVWVFLIFRSIDWGCGRNYRLVWLYLFARMTTEVSLPLILYFFGHTSSAYAYSYIVLSLTLVALAVAVLIGIYSVLSQVSLRADWYLLAGVAVVIFLGYSDDRQIWPLFRLLDISYTILTFVGAATLVRMVRRRSRINLGWNLKMVLLALTLPASFYTLVFATYTMGMDLSYQNATYWIQGTSLASWIILAAGMSHYSPPRKVGPRSAGAVLHGDSAMNQNGSERFSEAELECHIGGVSS